jgi:metal-responsive CopG/Arc/MetJ family transcriptional regulator
MVMSRTTKIVGFSVPPPLVREVEQVAKAERRTKSELFREMFRVYKRYRKQREQEEDDWVLKLIREAKEEQEKNPMTPEEIITELEDLGRQVSVKAKARGIKAKDVDRIIHAARKRWAAA